MSWPGDVRIRLIRVTKGFAECLGRQTRPDRLPWYQCKVALMGTKVNLRPGNTRWAPS